MTSRGDILADTVARLEAERFQAPRRPDLTPARASGPAPTPLPKITREEAQENARILLEAIDDIGFADLSERRSIA